MSDALHASGRVALREIESGGVLFGWYNTNSGSWRTNNSLVMRIEGSSNANVHIEYGTRLNGAHAVQAVDDVAADDEAHIWDLSYDPEANGGNGRIRLVWDGVEHVLDVLPEHRAAGAELNRFGILNQQIPTGTTTLYFDDLVVDGVEEDFDRDPSWEGIGNRQTYEDCERRPWHDYGFVNVVAGQTNGAVGGLIWRSDVTQPNTFTYYADRIGPLSFARELCAQGVVRMTRAASGSAVMLGWFASSDRGLLTERFLGILIEGPSRTGHWFRPSVLGIAADEGPTIAPDGTRHTFVMSYRPFGDNGEIVLTFDGTQHVYGVQRDPRSVGMVDRFGMLGVQPGGEFLEVFFDDLRYTAAVP